MTLDIPIGQGCNVLMISFKQKFFGFLDIVVDFDAIAKKELLKNFLIFLYFRGNFEGWNNGENS